VTSRDRRFRRRVEYHQKYSPLLLLQPAATVNLAREREVSRTMRAPPVVTRPPCSQGRHGAAAPASMLPIGG
jgi:hypothetical protein